MSDLCGMQSPAVRAEKGNERNGKVIRRGRRTSYVGEGSGTLGAYSEFCLGLGHPGSASVLGKPRAPRHTTITSPAL